MRERERKGGILFSYLMRCLFESIEVHLVHITDGSYLYYDVTDVL